MLSTTVAERQHTQTTEAPQEDAARSEDSASGLSGGDIGVDLLLEDVERE